MPPLKHAGFSVIPQIATYPNLQHCIDSISFGNDATAKIPRRANGAPGNVLSYSHLPQAVTGIV